MDIYFLHKCGRSYDIQLYDLFFKRLPGSAFKPTTFRHTQHVISAQIRLKVGSRLCQCWIDSMCCLIGEELIDVFTARLPSYSREISFNRKRIFYKTF